MSEHKLTHTVNHDADSSRVSVHAAPNSGRTIVVSVVIVVVLLLVGFAYAHHRRSTISEELAAKTEQDTQAEAPVDVVRVAYSPAGSAIDLPGEARAWYESTIYARVSGYIGKWYTDIGARVKKGDVLAEIQTPEIDDQLKAAQAKVTADESLVAVAQANEDFAKSTNSRWASSPKGVVSLQEQEEKKSEFVSSSARTKAAQAQLALDRAEVNRLEDLTAFKEVRAPYDGVITLRRIDIGDLVNAGSATGNSQLYDIVQSDRIRVYVQVPQAASPDIVVGMKAVATGREYPGRTFEGTIARTSESIDPIARTEKVEVDIENPKLTLKPGMYMNVSFSMSSHAPSLRVPAAALNFRSAGPQVAVVDPSGTVSFHAVQISRDLGSFVELSSGVSAGDMVALNISNQIAEGDKVQAVAQGEEQRPAEDAKPVAVINVNGDKR